MSRRAIIYRVDLEPMVKVGSIITVWVVVPDSHQIFKIQETGSLDKLSERFGFEILNENNWVLNKMYKRDCLIDINKDKGYAQFVSYI